MAATGRAGQAPPRRRFAPMKNIFAWLLLIWLLPHLAAAKPPGKVPVFRPGHYRLADGTRHTGYLLVGSDNELLVKDEKWADARVLAAVQVRNCVIEADSFTVLRDFDVVLNGVAAHYPVALVQVRLPGPDVALYQITGLIDVYVKPEGLSPGGRIALAGVGRGLSGVAAALIIAGVSERPTGTFRTETRSTYLLRHPAYPVLATLQPNVGVTRAILTPVLADDPLLSRELRKARLTDERIYDLMARYVAHKKS